MGGRCYKLLASVSVPLKQTIVWCRRFTTSLVAKAWEFPEIVSYLISTKAGQRVAKEAGGGRAWYTQAFRETDLAIYVISSC